jgi:hypothetical protein
MTQEFVLSEKICGTLELGSFTSEFNENLIDVIDIEDVKEFIKRLKEDFENACKEEDEECPFITLGQMDEIIDKLSGEKLIK